MARRWWLGGGAAAVVVVLLGATLVVRYLGGSCTAAGCSNAVTFDLRSVVADGRPSGTSVQLCANDTCTTSVLVAGQTFVRTTLGERSVRSATVRIVAADGNLIAEATLPGPVDADESRPNGQWCEPTCWQLTLALVGGALQPESAERSRARTTGTR